MSDIIYSATVTPNDIGEINVSAGNYQSNQIKWTPPYIPDNAVIHSVTFTGTVYSLDGGSLDDVTIVVDTRMFYVNGSRVNMEVDLGTNHRKHEIQFWVYAGTRSVSRLVVMDRQIKIKYSLVDVHDDLSNSNICLSDVPPKGMFIGGNRIEKAYLGNKSIYELIPSEDIIAVYTAIKPKKMVLVTFDEFYDNHSSWSYSKTLTNLNLDETHMYYVTYGDGYDNEMSYLTADVSRPDIFEMEYEYQYTWSGDEIQIGYNRATGTTDCYFYFGYSDVDDDIVLLDYSETTVYEEEYLNLSGTVVTRDGISYLCRNSSDYAPTSINCANNYNLVNLYKIPDSVTNMTYAFKGCLHLNNMACGKNVTIMDEAFFNCRRLGPIVYCEENVTSMYRTFYSSFYNYGFTAAYLMSPNITNMTQCFMSQNTNTLSKIYVPRNSTTLNTCLQTSSSSSITGVAMTFTYNSTYDRYEEATQNIHIYPVDDVRALYNEAISS